MMRFTALALGLLISACGSEAKHSGDSNKSPAPAPDAAATRHSLMIADASALPICDATSEGWIVYVASDKVLEGCSAGAWAKLDLLKGDKGDAGKDGAGDKIVSRFLCHDQLEAGAHISYSASVMASGNVFASGEVSGTLYQIGASDFWAPQTPGADLGYISFVEDGVGSGNGAFWKVGLDRNTLILTAQYDDADLTPNIKTYTSTADKCTKTAY